jgi:UDP-N-acetylglucosamine transferase subunit ALG13
VEELDDLESYTLEEDVYHADVSVKNGKHVVKIGKGKYRTENDAGLSVYRFTTISKVISFLRKMRKLIDLGGSISVNGSPVIYPNFVSDDDVLLYVLERIHRL